jgi:hypothetical protein
MDLSGDLLYPTELRAHNCFCGPVRLPRRTGPSSHLQAAPPSLGCSLALCQEETTRCGVPPSRVPQNPERSAGERGFPYLGDWLRPFRAIWSIPMRRPRVRLACSASSTAANSASSGRMPAGAASGRMYSPLVRMDSLRLEEFGFGAAHPPQDLHESRVPWVVLPDLGVVDGLAGYSPSLRDNALGESPGGAHGSEGLPEELRVRYLVLGATQPAPGVPAPGTPRAQVFSSCAGEPGATGGRP